MTNQKDEALRLAREVMAGIRADLDEQAELPADWDVIIARALRSYGNGRLERSANLMGLGGCNCEDRNPELFKELGTAEHFVDCPVLLAAAIRALKEGEE